MVCSELNLISYQKYLDAVYLYLLATIVLHPTLFLQPPSGFVVKSQVYVGEEFPVAFIVVNVGEVALLDVIPYLSVYGDGVVTLVSGPDPPVIETLEPGGSGNYTWIFRADREGEVRFHCYVTARRADTGEYIQSEEAVSKIVAIMSALAPVADPDGPYTGVEGEPVTLNASGSYDPDGEIVKYEWDLNGDGAYDYESSSPLVQAVWSDDFSGTVILRVTDSQGLQSVGTTSVTVYNSPPTLEAIENVTAIVGEEVLLKAEAFDPGNDTLRYTWDFGDGTMGEGETVSHVYKEAGEYTVTLTVSDDDGGTAETSFKVVVGETTAPPRLEAIITVSDLKPTAGKPVTITVLVRNAEAEEYTVKVDYVVNGEVAHSKYLSVPPAGETTDTWIITVGSEEERVKVVLKLEDRRVAESEEILIKPVPPTTVTETPTPTPAPTPLRKYLPYLIIPAVTAGSGMVIYMYGRRRRKAPTEEVSVPPTLEVPLERVPTTYPVERVPLAYRRRPLGKRDAEEAKKSLERGLKRGREAEDVIITGRGLFKDEPEKSMETSIRRVTTAELRRGCENLQGAVAKVKASISKNLERPEDHAESLQAIKECISLIDGNIDEFRRLSEALYRSCLDDVEQIGSFISTGVEEAGSYDKLASKALSIMKLHSREMMLEAASFVYNFFHKEYEPLKREVTRIDRFLRGVEGEA